VFPTSISVMPKREQKKPDLKDKFTKLGAKALEGVNKISFYRGEMEFCINSPEVYFNEATQTYYFVGEPRQVDY